MDWRSLLKDQTTPCELANGIRRIYTLANRKPPELTLSSADEYDILILCRKAIQPNVMALFEAINATDKILPLVLHHINDMNTLAIFATDTTKASVLEFDRATLYKCTLTLQLRSKILNSNWPINDDPKNEASTELLEKVCSKCPTIASFRLLPYDQLKQQFLDYATPEQQGILEAIWIDDNKLRTKVKEYNLPLALIKILEENGTKSIDDISDNDVSALIKVDQKRMTEQLEQNGIDKQQTDFIIEQHAKFKSNLTQLRKKETKKGQEEEAEKRKQVEENKKQTVEAIKNIEEINKNLKTLSSKQVEDNLKSVAEKLKVEWKFSSEELEQSNKLIETILKDLNTAKTELEATCGSNYKTDEEIISHISGGMALYGIQLLDPEKFGEKAGRQLLSCPLYCPLLSPEYAFQSNVQNFTSLQALNRFRKNIQTSGLSVALSLEASAWGASLKTGLSRNTQDTSDEEKQTKSQSRKFIQTEYIVKPVKCFRIPREQMRLSSEAENALKTINNKSKAKDFLRSFNSHVNDGRQHIGGIFIRTVDVETKEETDVASLEKIASKNFAVDIGGGCIGYGFGGVSVENFTSDGSKTGTEEISRTATVKRHVYCMGPDCSNIELFTKTLISNNSTWYIIDRDTISSFVPIWEIILTSYSLQSDLCQAAELIKQVWLQEADANQHIPIIQYEIQRVLSSDYSSSMSMLLPSFHNNGKKVTLNIRDVVKKLDDEIEKCLTDNFNVDELSSNHLLSKVCTWFKADLVKKKSVDAKADTWRFVASIINI
ncbi:unnamed protein product [Adineta ricciae]|uniref:Uncharacterized protein n=1 Tax=Adineta ricciae TaxID=249248 RepID=A0A814JKW2_ADIRI|nr:unnamed protein product [Adineta ricciae]CAF1482815.1 unnamed protein product [Adineta ricciae]